LTHTLALQITDLQALELRSFAASLLQNPTKSSKQINKYGVRAAFSSG
jgi:hypothetical protein